MVNVVGTLIGFTIAFSLRAVVKYFKLRKPLGYFIGCLGGCILVIGHFYYLSEKGLTLKEAPIILFVAYACIILSFGFIAVLESKEDFN